METSSPLAALHRPMLAPSWGARDVFRSHSYGPFSGSNQRHSQESTKLSLRERLQKNAGDYFSARDVQDSSPAACLAADLSQNFRLDSDPSPQFPTPRRALFSTNMSGSLGGRGLVTTPPLPSSSPGPMTELMDISPLPHKAPFLAQLEVTSPTPLSTPIEDDDLMLDTPAPTVCQTFLEPPSAAVADRKIAAPRRPSLGRMKNYTTGAVPTLSRVESQPSRSRAETQLPPFRFGPESSFNQTCSNLTPVECFESASPPLQRRPHSANSQAAPVPVSLRARPQFSNVNGVGSSRHGSPLHCHPRRPSNPLLRNRKQFRRSLSMFESPAEVLKSKPEVEEAASSMLQSVMDVEEAHEPLLPHFLSEDASDSIPRITKATFLDVLDRNYAGSFDQSMIIDCRFEYEYNGGHIDGALNYNDKELLANQLFRSSTTNRTLIIFHCEYSAHRAPLMARHVRSVDRTTNAAQYPRLSYPDVYILDGGYSAFFAEHRIRCFPPAYVEMSDENHQRTCEREMGRLKARKGLSRAQTFAFGQRGSHVDDSPTASSRPSSRQMLLSMMGSPPALGDRNHARRMASY